MAEQLMILPEAAMARGQRHAARRGHAGYPGEGPDGEFCKTCRHHVRDASYSGRKSWFKCALMHAVWTGGTATDIKANDPACGKWESMMVLSIRQPWAYAILHLGKDVENRTWRTKNYRGPFYIHASQKVDKEAIGYLRGQGYELPETFKTGGIVGQAVLTNCVEKHYSDWFTGPYGFALGHIKPLAFLPMKGAQGWFNPKKDVQP